MTTEDDPPFLPTDAAEHPPASLSQKRALLEAHLEQPHFVARMEAYAHSRLWQVGLAQVVIPDEYAADLVQQIIADTLDGVIAWPPPHISLQKHVMDAIQSRTRHDAARAGRFLRLDASTQERVLAEQRAEQDATAELAATAGRVIDAMRALAASDGPVLALLDAYEADAFKREDVLRFTGLTAKEYDAARARMRRMRDQLPADLQGYVRRRS